VAAAAAAAAAWGASGSSPPSPRRGRVSHARSLSELWASLPAIKTGSGSIDTAHAPPAPAPAAAAGAAAASSSCSAPAPACTPRSAATPRTSPFAAAACQLHALAATSSNDGPWLAASSPLEEREACGLAGLAQAVVQPRLGLRLPARALLRPRDDAPPGACAQSGGATDAAWEGPAAASPIARGATQPSLGAASCDGAGDASPASVCSDSAYFRRSSTELDGPASVFACSSMHAAYDEQVTSSGQYAAAVAGLDATSLSVVAEAVAAAASGSRRTSSSVAGVSTLGFWLSEDGSSSAVLTGTSSSAAAGGCRQWSTTSTATGAAQQQLPMQLPRIHVPAPGSSAAVEQLAAANMETPRSARAGGAAAPPVQRSASARGCPAASPGSVRRLDGLPSPRIVGFDCSTPMSQRCSTNSWRTEGLLGAHCLAARSAAAGRGVAPPVVAHT